MSDLIGMVQVYGDLTNSISVSNAKDTAVFYFRTPFGRISEQVRIGGAQLEKLIEQLHQIYAYTPTLDQLKKDFPKLKIAPRDWAKDYHISGPYAERYIDPRKESYRECHRKALICMSNPYDIAPGKTGWLE